MCTHRYLARSCKQRIVCVCVNFEALCVCGGGGGGGGGGLLTTLTNNYSDNCATDYNYYSTDE